MYTWDRVDSVPPCVSCASLLILLALWSVATQQGSPLPLQPLTDASQDAVTHNKVSRLNQHCSPTAIVYSLVLSNRLTIRYDGSYTSHPAASLLYHN